ncbi:hypothetical protein BT96DRAFT_819854, partial [Gymnopus androsaceus JB14]
WLIIFDNADDPTLNLGNYFPRVKQMGSIIVTTRNSSMPASLALPGYRYTIGELDISEAIELLFKHAEINESASNQAAALEVVQELGCFALAIAVAGAYISQSYTLLEFLKEFKKHKNDILKEGLPQSADGYQHTVFSAFKLSYSKLSTNAQLLLQLCSFFHYSNVPVALFAIAGENLDTKITVSGEENPCPEASEILHTFLCPYIESEDGWNSFKFQKTIVELTNHSLVSFHKETQMLTFHPLLHSSAQNMVERPKEMHVLLHWNYLQKQFLGEKQGCTINYTCSLVHME